MNPTGQIAIVTGAGSGLGEATARALAARGARVAAVDLDILDCLGGYEIFIGIGIDDSGEGRFDVFKRDAH